MDNIFAENAEAYWDAGLQVIPLYPKSKRPMMNDWSKFADQKVSEEDQKTWLSQNSGSNMGLVLGPASGVCVIDVDTDDPKLFEAIVSVLPPSPWARKGRKGIMLAYRFSGIKTHRVKNASGQTLVECLSARTQCVLPPSVHPDTGVPYTENVPLYTVLHQLVALPDNVEELLRQALVANGVELSHAGWSKVTEFVSAGARDTTLTEMAGLFAYAVTRGERSLREAIGMLRSFHSEFIEQAAGDLADIEKHVSNLIKFLERDVRDKGKVLPLGWDAGLSVEDKAGLGVTLGREETEWSYDEIVEFLRTRFENELKNKERSEAVESILSRIARSPSLSRIDEDRILKYIVEVSGMGVPVATYRARLKELRQGDVAGNDQSEIARAVLKDLEQYNLIRFHGGKFMKWAGSHWVVMEVSHIQNHISSNYGHLAAAKKHNDINGIMKILSFLCDQDILKERIKGVNFANGFLTEELKLVPHNPDYGMTYTLPFRYMPEFAGNFPSFGRFLETSWGRDHDYAEKLDALQEVLCVTLFGLGSKFQKAILLHGAPSSGKTQLLRIVQSLVPSEARCSLAPDGWADKFMSVVMHKKILNVCGELSERKISGQLFKDIVDGSERPAQFKNEQIFQMRPELTHWFASNHLPKTDDTSHGFIRRWLMLTFHYPVPKEKIELDLGDRISAEEREAIVAWAALAMVRLKIRNNFTIPASHQLLVTEFANINNSVRMFMMESGKCRFGVPDGQVSESKAFNAYWSWCSANGGSKPVPLPKFRAMLRELQNEIDFKLKIFQTSTGGTEAVLDGMTISA